MTDSATSGGGGARSWSDEDLEDVVDAYQAGLEAAGLRDSAVRTYVRESRTFLRWRTGRATPSGGSLRTRRPHQRITPLDLRAELAEYEAVLRATPLAAASVQSYLSYARMFIGWSDGSYRPRGPNRRGEPLARAIPRRSPVAGPTTRASDSTDLTVDEVRELGSFDWRWPENVEHFDHGWEYVATGGAASYRIRHGIGGRDVYGRFRVHSVTWVDGQPMVEGVAPDDYDDGGALLSTIRIEGGEHVRALTDLPIGYAGFHIVRQIDEIAAKYSRRSLAAKILDDDLGAWARHAILRLTSKPAGKPSGRTDRAGLEPDRPTMPRLEPPPKLDRTALVASMLSFGTKAKAELDTAGEPFFTENPAANRFVIENPFAFLLAVIFDQGIVAERAWAAPYELQRRLGHLDPVRIAAEPDSVAAAIQQPPTLQRFINTLPGWVVAAARRVISHYGSDAGRIWADEPSAGQLERRFDEFQGIGQKKAAMAVEMLERDLRVKIKDLQQTDIAFDVHIRRVMLRTGLAERDDRDHMIEEARQANPARPGAIDFPMWLVGRRWCRPGVPLCPDCPLFDVCPRLVDRAADVRGA